MATMGGYIRFYLGIVLAIEILRLSFFSQPISYLSLVLAAAYLASSVFYFLRKLSG